MTSARTDILFVCGRNFKMFLTVCQLLLSLMIRSCACMVAYRLSLLLCPSCNKLLDQPKCLKMVFFVTFCGLIPRKANPPGVKTIAVSPTPSVKQWLNHSSRKTTSTWSVVLTKSSKMATSSSAAANLWQCSVRQTTAVNSTTRVL